MRRQDQILEWVKGNSIHNYEFDECCPDFSCCHADLLASDEEREAFATAYVNGNHGLMNEYLMVFLLEDVELRRERMKETGPLWAEGKSRIANRKQIEEG